MSTGHVHVPHRCVEFVVLSSGISAVVPPDCQQAAQQHTGCSEPTFHTGRAEEHLRALNNRRERHIQAQNPSTFGGPRRHPRAFGSFHYVHIPQNTGGSCTFIACEYSLYKISKVLGACRVRFGCLELCQCFIGVACDSKYVKYHAAWSCTSFRSA